MKDNQKHIIICTSEFPPQPGGIGNHAFNLARQLQINGFEVKVITDQRSNTGDQETDFDSANMFGTLRVKRYDMRFLMYLKRIQFLLKTIKKMNTVIASGKFSLWIVAFSSLFFKRKYIAVIHGTEVNFSNTLLKYSINKALKRFDTIVAVSNYTKSLVDHLSVQNISVIPNGFDHTIFKIEPIAKGVICTGNPKLVTVGNVTERKGQLNVIKHLPELIKKYPDLHYHCIGLPTEREKFLNFASELNVSDHVVFHGRLSNAELKSVLEQSDIFVMMSSATASGDVEGFGIAMIEANAMGLPSIGSEGCGIEDAILNHKSGLLIPHNDTSKFIHAISEILDNYDSYEKASKEWAKKHQWDVIIKRYIDILIE